MAPFDTESQFKFLLACIKHSYAGKVDFEEVANECDCASKAAAARRYRKLMKTHNISPGGRPTGVKKEYPDGRRRSPKHESRTKSEGTKTEDLGDVDEPENVKQEVKTEDGIRVKNEHCDGYGAAACASFNILPTGQRVKQEQREEDGQDDEVLIVSATHNQDKRSASTIRNDPQLQLLPSHFPCAHSFTVPSTPSASLQSDMMTSTMRAPHLNGFAVSPWAVTEHTAHSGVWHGGVEGYGHN